LRASPRAPCFDERVGVTEPRYTRTAVLLHWVVAGMVFVQFPWGWWMQSIAKIPVGPRVNAYNLHKSIGLSILALVVARLVCRLMHQPPALPSMPAWQRRAARINHSLLYLVIVAMPIVGYLGSAFSGYPVKYFGWTLPSWSARHDTLKDVMSQVHLGLSFLLGGLVLLHLAAVIKHTVQGGRALLMRMAWPRAR